MATRGDTDPNTSSRCPFLDSMELIPSDTWSSDEMEQSAYAAQLRLASRLEQLGEHRLGRQLLRCGFRRIIRRDSSGREYLAPMRCHKAICSSCALARKRKHFAILRPRVEAVLSRNGLALSLTIGRSGEGTLLERLDAFSCHLRSHLGAKAFRRSLREGLGVILSLEIGPGQRHVGHPHAHILLIGSDAPKVTAFAAQLDRRFGEEASPHALRINHLESFSTSQNWQSALAYLLKGSAPAANLPRHRLVAILEALSAGKRLFSLHGSARLSPHMRSPRHSGAAA